MNEFENLDNEEKELQAKLEEIRQKRKELELKKPCEFRIRSLNGAMVFIHSTYREDVVTEFKNTKGRFYREYEKENSVPVIELENLIERVKKLDNITIVYNAGIEEMIQEYLYAPEYSVALRDRDILVKMNRSASSYYFQNIPGFGYNHEKRTFTIPLGEGWRIVEIAEKQNYDSIVYSDEAQAFILKQVEDRARIDVVAKAKDWDIGEIPAIHDIVLRPFQRVGVEFFTINGGRGLLADEMGLGKTIQMIALAMRLGFQKNLVICPASLKVNWQREIAKFTNETQYILSGEIPTAFDISHIIANKPRFTIINYDILGTKYEEDKVEIDVNGFKHKKHIIRYPWLEALNLCSFDNIILDEAHYIKNVDSQRSVACRQLKAPNVLGLTGTPVLNRPGEYWAILNLIAPATFPSYETFIKQYTWDKKTARNVDELRELLRPIMLRRLKKDVIEELPPINRINDFYELSPKARKIYDRILEGIYDVLAEYNPEFAGESQKITSILVQIMRMKQVVAIDGVEGTTDLATSIYDSSVEGEAPKKVLIFSQFKPTTYAIRQRLGNEALGFVERVGNEFKTIDDRARQLMIDQFQSDPNIHFLCVTEKTAKEGYNITAAQAVIFNDLFWTPAGHQQAEGRSYGRLANLHPIDSYYRIGVDSISEWIMELLAAKLNIIEQVVEGVEASRQEASLVQDLIKKMKERMWTRK